MDEIREPLADLNSSSGWPDQPAFISDAELLRDFVSPQMMSYFQAKMPDMRSETLVLRVCELLKYLIFVQYSPGRILFGREIDDVWHYWILQTRQYAQLCEKLPGNFFRHHSSVAYLETARAVQTADPSEAVQRILSFFISYYRNFGPMTDDRVACWPTIQRIMNEAGWDLAGLNHFLCEMAFASAPQSPSVNHTERNRPGREEVG
jgi:hypothetical protein